MWAQGVAGRETDVDKPEIRRDNEKWLEGETKKPENSGENSSPS